MSEREYDILIIGATGYTAFTQGQLVIEYLANHSRASSLRIALGGRTISKVQELVAKYKNVRAVYVDVSKEPSVEEAVAKTRVVINIAGPYWTRGSVVVKACARNGVHYVDLTGEAPWVAKIIEQCVINYVLKAASNHMVEVNNQFTVPLHISSTAAHTGSGGVSGGTAASLMSAFEEVPREQMAKGLGWELSPSAFHTINASIVRRSWGLRYYRAPEAKRPTFSYTEFTTINGSPFWGILISLTVFIFGAAMALLPPFRWLVKNVLPKSGEGPSPDKLDKGYFGVVNVAEGGDVVVKATLDGDGDPGYRLTSIMIVESALLLLDSENLTEIGKEGGVLTPSVAYGDALLKALEGTGRFKIGVEVLEDKKMR
ncbi:saccharopine dehydrogenase domain-containing protein [Rhizoctonia solani AG-1 IA]|uniref:Saccharopine dehydrogenase domain-containing protein n=1 Tax=Thanatephorus cucumeris (strain AG1-IA) TaxID=983506 RepID=L8WZE9_THACA|nr:saccharopine dehydrogenase domain-containing protein [Rhizoctonia solani AG-1 IA]